MKSKTHKFTISLTFDKPCTKAYALREARDCVHGNFYPYQDDIDKDPGEFRIRAIGKLSK